MIKIAVKELAYFTCQSGNLTPEFFSNKDETIGKKMHQYLQSKYNEKSQNIPKSKPVPRYGPW